MTKTITKGLLLKKGYTEWKQDNFQKRFTDNKGVKFFINAVHYNFGNLLQLSSMWEFDMQIDTPKGSVNITLVQWFNNDGESSRRTIKDAEDYLEKMWILNGRPYYEVYNKNDK